MATYRESVQEFRLRNGTVRVWRQARDGERIEPLHDEDVSALLTGLCKDDPLHVENLAIPILEMERVNAVEVKDRAGNGVVLYKDWP